MSLKDVIGQEKAINIIQGSISRNRIPSAYLFAGESGIGKKFTAVNMAKILNCQSIQHSAVSCQFIDCCDECASCRKIDAQIHPDFLMVAPEKGEVRIAEIRAVEEVLSFAPYEGQRKVVIIDDAETMNSAAANAFLKTLEEPPSLSLIILISSSPDRLPETIRSRCSRINFSPLPFEMCEEVIKKAVNQQAASSSLYKTVARLAMGRPGLAVSGDLIEEREWFIKLLQEMISGRDKEIWTDKEEIGRWFDSAFVLLRDLAVFKITGRGDMLINIDLMEKIAGLSKSVGLKDIIESYSKLSFLRGYVDFNLNKAITWNYTSFIMSRFKRSL
ncbi:MAG: DNA polymerase III subunit delta' [Nitrospirae bacterium]|nr:DNA polymerase III subunit delta' [Nitrospirota bacterium]